MEECKYGYHISDIKKGELGKISKIQEELDELKDAEKQDSKVMMMVELSDLYGALESYCDSHEKVLKNVGYEIVNK